MTKIVEKGSNITVSYTGSLEDGTVFDSTEKHWGTPLEFTAGAGQMIKGFDEWVMGMKEGEEKTIEIKAIDAYWEKDDSKKQVIPKKDFMYFSLVEHVEDRLGHDTRYSLNSEKIKDLNIIQQNYLKNKPIFNKKFDIRQWILLTPNNNYAFS